MNNIVGKQIKIAMKFADLTQQELAKKINISRQYLSQLINGHYLPSSEILKQIAKATNQKITFFTNNSNFFIPEEKTFSKKLKRLLQAKNMSQLELAKKLKCTQATINEWCNNNRSNPLLSTYAKLAKALGVPISYFLDDKQQQNFFVNSGIVGDNSQMSNSNNTITDLQQQIKQLSSELAKLQKDLKK